jgi:hypothetical protein
VCHYSLDRRLDKFFEIIIEDIKNNGIDPDRISDKLPITIKTFSLERLKEDLEKFSKEFLDNQKFDWVSFRKQLYNVLIDQKLKIPIPKYLIFSYKKISSEIFNTTFDNRDDLEVNLEIENLKITGSYNDSLIERS